jgi:diaminopimelate epimerase
MISAKFSKMVASGNDFVVTEIKNQKSKIKNLNNLARKICDRKYGVGADGLLVLEKSRRADIRMRIFNPDGSEAEMCGNGARCACLYMSAKLPAQPLNFRRDPEYREGERREKAKTTKLKIETKAGIIESEVHDKNVKIKLTDPRDIKLDIPIKINNRSLRVNFINTGVPHTVVFVDGLREIDVENLGRQIRGHRIFQPAGTNVNFVEVIDEHSLKIRTYERGVEEETLACGTGSVAAALITSCKLQVNGRVRMDMYTQGEEVLAVYFEKSGFRFSNVWLQGRAERVFKGEFAL